MSRAVSSPASPRSVALPPPTATAATNTTTGSATSGPQNLERANFFLGPSAELYDAVYVRAGRNFGDASAAATQLNPTDANPLREILPPFPVPDALMSYWEYELELLSWRAAVEKAVGSFKLPELTGRHVYRPVVVHALNATSTTSVATGAPAATIVSTSTSSSAGLSSQRRGSVDLSQPGFGRRPLFSPPSPRSELLSEIGSTSGTSSPTTSNLISGSAGSSGGSSDGMLATSGSSDATLLAASSGATTVAMDDLWDTLLIPPQPTPSQYTSFDDYYSAMIRWTNLIQSSFGSAIPPCASLLPCLAPLQRTAKSRANSSAQGSQSLSSTRKKGGWASDWYDMTKLPAGMVISQRPLPGITMICELQSDVSSGQFSPVHIALNMLTTKNAVPSIDGTHMCPSSSPSTPLSTRIQDKLMKSFDKMLRHARQNYSTTGRTSPRVRTTLDSSSPPLDPDSGPSPLSLLQQNVKSKHSLSVRSAAMPRAKSARNTPISAQASYGLRLQQSWPTPSKQRSDVESVIRALEAIIMAPTQSFSLDDWSQTRVRLSWIVSGESPYPSNGPFPTVIDLCLHLADSLYHLRDDAETARRFCGFFSRLAGLCKDRNVRLRASTIFSHLCRNSSAFPSMFAKCIPSPRHLSDSTFKSAWETVSFLRGLCVLLIHIPSVFDASSDLFWCSEESIVLLSKSEPALTTPFLLAISRHYLSCIRNALEHEFRAHTQVDRITAASSITAVVSQHLTQYDECISHSSNVASASFSRCFTKILGHRSANLASLGYFVFSAIVLKDLALRMSPSTLMLMRTLLNSKLRHARWLGTRLSALVTSSPDADLASLCSGIPTQHILDDIVRKSDSAISVLSFWERTTTRVAADIQEAPSLAAYPSLLCPRILEELIEKICLTKVRLDVNGTGSEVERCYFVCRTLLCRANIISTLCYLFAKCQVIGVTSKPLKDEKTPHFPYRISLLTIIRIMKLIQDPHPIIPAASSAGKLHASARASLALALVYLLGDRHVAPTLIKWWKKSPKALNKLVSTSLSSSTKATTRFRSLSAIPDSPIVALLHILIGMLKQSASYDYIFGATVVHCINCHLISHPRLGSSLIETPLYKPKSSTNTHVDHLDESYQPLIFHIMESLTLGPANSNSVSLSGLHATSHHLRLLSQLFMGSILEKNTKQIYDYIVKNHHVIKINLVMRRIQELSPGIALLVVKEFLSSLLSTPYGSKLYKLLEAVDFK